MPQIALTSDGALPRRSKRARPSAPSPSVLLRYLLVSFFGFLAVSAAADVAEIIAFDLLPVTDLRAGLFEVSLGPENGGNVQKVALLAGFATNTGAMMELPVASLCTPGSTGNWNVISFPSTGNVVVVGGNQTDSTLVPIKWSPTVSSFKTDTFVGLVLRKGKGNQAKNVSTISSEWPSSGRRRVRWSDQVQSEYNK